MCATVICRFPSLSLRGTRRSTTAPIPMIADCGLLIIGVSNRAPRLPVLVIVKVPPTRSSDTIRPFRTLSARTAMVPRRLAHREKASRLRGALP